LREFRARYLRKALGMGSRFPLEHVLIVAMVCVAGCAAEGGGSPAGSGGSSGRPASAGAADSLRAEAGGGAPQAMSAGAAGGALGDCPEAQVDCNGVCVGAGVDGGGCTVLATTGVGVDVQRMVLDDSHVYWAEQGYRTAIARAPKAGGPRQQLIETDSLPDRLALNASSVIWSEGISTVRLLIATKTGDTATELATTADEISAIDASDLRVYFATGSPGGEGVLYSVGLENKDRIAHGKASIWPNTAWIAHNDSTLYWSIAPGDIRTTTLEGQDPAELTCPGLTSAFLLRDSSVYVTHGNQGEKSLSRLAAESGEKTLLYAGPEVDSRLGASGTTLYFGGADTIYALAAGDAKPALAFSTRSMLRFWVADDTGIYAALRTNLGDTLVVKVR
jgi:hypothetical protein